MKNPCLLSLAFCVLAGPALAGDDTKANREDGQSSIVGQTVSLAVKPEEAQQLSLAQATGELKLALRGSGDREHVQTNGARVMTLGRQRFDGENSENKDDGGNLIVDCALDIPEPGPLQERLNRIPGVVETGLFIGIASRVIAGTEAGPRILERS